MTTTTFAVDLTKCQRPTIKSPGVKYISRKLIQLDKIYVPPFTNNPVRKKGKNLEHVDKLTISFSHGIDYSKDLPTVRKFNRIINGVHYDYELVTGNHRYEALMKNGYEEWAFDVYQFGDKKVSYDDALRTFQLLENDHAPQLEASMDDVSNIVIAMIQNNSNLINNDEKSIAEYVDKYCTNMHHATRGKVIRSVVSSCGAYQDVASYTPFDVQKWINNYTSMTMGGVYDSRRKSHGWTVKEGYEYEYVMNAARKFHETGSNSYFVCHTKTPTQQENLHDKRQKMIDKFAELEDALLSVFEYYEQTGEFPWNVVGFLPADKLANEDMTKLVKI